MVYSHSPLIIKKTGKFSGDIECLGLEVVLSVLQYMQRPAFQLQLQRLPGREEASLEGYGLLGFYFLFWKTVLNSIGNS